MVARDSNGEYVWWTRHHIMGRPKLVDGEAFIFLHALSTVRDQGWQQIVIESDCLMVVNHLASASCLLASFRTILDSCLAL